MLTVAVGNTSTGSPVSRFPWQTFEVGGWPGNCQRGTAVFPKGSLRASEVSCESAVTSWNPAPNNPGEMQLEKAKIHRRRGQEDEIRSAKRHRPRRSFSGKSGGPRKAKLPWSYSCCRFWRDSWTRLRPSGPASRRPDEWPCGFAGTCRSGRCCRSWRRQCRRRWALVSWQAARPRT
jgi:hypothetical protein